MKVGGVSFSSDKKLARCEMQYHYRYDEKLKPKVKKIGLFRGDWGHQLLEAYYKDPNRLVKNPKRRIKVKSSPTGLGWKAKLIHLKATMWDKLFDEEKESYGLDFPDTVEELIEHYIDHWGEEEKNWEIIQVEGDYELMTKLGFPIRWKSDLIVKDSGRTVLVETKFKKAIPDSSERILQPQIHAYAYLLSKMGIKIDKVLWNYVRTEPVPRPQILKSGALSTRQINTDQRGYLKSLREAGLYPEKEEDIIGLNNVLKELPETLTLERISNSVNLKMGEMFVREWVERARRAQSITKPLRSWSRDCKWMCDYYILCQADMRGDVDRQLLIKKDFDVNVRDLEVK